MISAQVAESREPQKEPRRPKLLFLAHRFPPSNASSSVRSWNIAKYLVRLGWEVNVVTPHPSLWRNAQSLSETEAKIEKEGIRRILTSQSWSNLMPDHFNCWNEGPGWVLGGVARKIARHFAVDSATGWIKPVMQSCSALTRNDVDIILATGAPFVSFKLANILSEKLSCPYVLDYRDPWSGNPHRTRSQPQRLLEEEAKLLSSCSGVVTVSPSWGTDLVKRFGVGSKLHVVPNGYDAEELGPVVPHNFGHFAIVYAGLFYPPKRVITPIMAALQYLKRTRKDSGIEWYFHYYGSQAPHVRGEAERFGVTDKVVLHGLVPRSEALSAVKGASVAVVITTVDDEISLNDQGIVPGKIFETLGLGVPMLVIAPPAGDVISILEPTGLAHVSKGSDVTGVARFLQEIMEGRPVRAKDVETCSWPNIAKRLDAILKMTLNSAGNPKVLS